MTLGHGVTKGGGDASNPHSTAPLRGQFNTILSAEPWRKESLTLGDYNSNTGEPLKPLAADVSTGDPGCYG